MDGHALPKMGSGANGSADDAAGVVGQRFMPSVPRKHAASLSRGPGKRDSSGSLQEEARPMGVELTDRPMDD